MPTYKVNQSSLPMARSLEASSASSPYNGSSTAILEGNRASMSYMELTEADREQEYTWKVQPSMTSSSSVSIQFSTGMMKDSGASSNTKSMNSSNGSHHNDDEEIENKMESLMEREIRLSLSRQREWATIHIVHPNSHIPSPPPTLLLTTEQLQQPGATDVQESCAGSVTSQRSSYVVQDVDTLDSGFTKHTTDDSSDVTNDMRNDSKRTSLTEERNPRHSSTVNPNEEMIIRELMEQKEREKELRQRRKELGIDADDDNEEGLEDDDNNNQVSNDVTTHQTDIFVHRSFVPIEEPKPVVANALWQSSSRSSNADGGAYEEPAWLVDRPTTTKSPRVQPLVTADDDEEDIFSRRFQYTPQNETPILREIRLINEREEALRQARGLPARLSLLSNGGEEGGEVVEEVEIVGLTNRPRLLSTERSSDDHVTMKKLADSRLQGELKNEKERELALRRQGSIHTISEERVGEPLKFVEIISPETELLLQAKAREREEKRQRALKEKEAREAAAASQHSSYRSCSSESTTTLHASGQDFTDRPGRYDTEKTLYGSKRNVISQSFTVTRTTPKVLLTYAYSPKQHGDVTDGAGSCNASLARQRIEEEVAEVQRRDEELRKMRRTIEALKSSQASYSGEQASVDTALTLSSRVSVDTTLMLTASESSLTTTTYTFSGFNDTPSNGYPAPQHRDLLRDAHTEHNDAHTDAHTDVHTNVHTNVHAEQEAWHTNAHTNVHPDVHTAEQDALHMNAHTDVRSELDAWHTNVHTNVHSEVHTAKQDAWHTTVHTERTDVPTSVHTEHTVWDSHGMLTKERYETPERNQVSLLHEWETNDIYNDNAST